MDYKMMILGLVTACFLTMLASCSHNSTTTSDSNVEETKKSPDQKADEVIARAVAVSGGNSYQDVNLEFTFRNRLYKVNRDDGLYTYQRIFTDSLGQRVEDILTNEGLVRHVEGERVDLSDKDRDAYTSSVNSVIYFVLLPYPLSDPAVRPEFIGMVDIKGQTYDKIKVTFDQLGGGEDYEDEFIYWFNTKEGTLDYLAYNYKTDGGGARFREAYNARTLGGIRFADYANYKPNPETRYILNFDSLFEVGRLEKLSLIETENIKVN